MNMCVRFSTFIGPMGGTVLLPEGWLLLLSLLLSILYIYLACIQSSPTHIDTFNLHHI